MKSRILCLLAVVALVAMTVPSFAAVENVKVGGDIVVKFIERANFDLQSDNGPDGEHYIYSGTRVFVSADLTDNVSTMIRVINERDWGNDEALDSTGTVLLYLAYVKFTDFLTKNLVMTVGRQEIQFGDGFIIGSRFRAYDYPANGTVAYDLGLMKAFDAVKLDYAIEGTPVSISAFRAKISESYNGSGYPLYGDLDLYGITVPVKCEKFYVEPYFTDAVVTHNELNQMTAGLRAGVMPIEGLDIKGEFAKQFGTADALVQYFGGTTGDFKGWAGTLGVGYTFQVPMKPMIAASYERCSAMKEPTSPATDVKSWVPVFPSNIADRVGKIAYPALFQMGDGASTWNSAANDGVSGLQVIKLAFAVQPVDKLGVALNLFNLRAVETPAGVDKEFGTEADLALSYKYTDDVTFGVDAGYLWAGDCVKDELGGSGDANAWQLIASMNVSF